MALKKLFLAHHSDYETEVALYAAALRGRGVVPWLDRDGGFRVGDECEEEARRAIRDDCFGLSLYATRSAFGRRFIREVEMDEARKAKCSDPNYLLFALARGIDFDEVKRFSLTEFGIDMSQYHGVTIADDRQLGPELDRTANDVLKTVLKRSARERGTGDLALQFSTVEVLPVETDDVLCIDATKELAPGASAEVWHRASVALRDVKRSVAAVYGRPRLHVHGTKSLPAAFLFGRVFSRFLISVRQNSSQVWCSDARASRERPFAQPKLVTHAGRDELSVEVTTGHHNVSADVDGLMTAGKCRASWRLQLRPHGGPLTVTEASCRAMVEQTLDAILAVRRGRQCKAIHLFAAAPMAFVMMLGQKFGGLPPVWLYEWDGRRYIRCCQVPAGRL